MRFGRQAQESESIQMAPLIDIVFVTLVCFMTTSVYAMLEREVDIHLPTADSSVMGSRTPGEIYINLRADGVVVLNQRKMKLPEQLPELQGVLNKVAEYFPGGAVIIRGDRGAPLGHAIAILDCCRKADIPNISFASLKEAPSEAE